MTEAEARGAEDTDLAAALARAREQQAAVSDILRVISRSKDLQEVFDVIATSARRFCSAEDAMVAVVEGDRLVGKAHDGGVGWVVGSALLDRQLPAARCIVDRETIHVRDMQTDTSEDFRTAREIAVKYGIRTVLATPMIHDGKAIGSITLRRTEVRPFTDDQVELARTFADQAVIAIENVRLFNETTESLDQQTALSDVLRTISRSAFDLDAVLQTIVERAVALVGGAESAAITRRDGDEAVVLAGFGTVLRTLMAHGGRTPVSDKSLIGRALLTGKRQYIADATLDPSLPQDGPRTRLVIPFMRDGRAIGTLGVSHTLPKPIGDREMQMLETFADQAAIAIENVRLFNETREGLERQTALGEVLRATSASPGNIQPVLDAVAANAARLLDADDVLIARLDGVHVVMAAHVGEVPVLGAGVRAALDPGMVSHRAILEARAIHVPDLLATGDFPKATELARQTGQRTSLAVPLLREGTPIGAILIRRTEVRPFTEPQVQLLQAFADQAAIAIENVRLFNETKESLERQTALSEILRVIASSPSDQQPVFDAIATNAARYCGADDAAVQLVQGDEMVRVAHHGPVPYHSGPNVPLDRAGVAGRAILDGRTVHVADITGLAGDEFPTTRLRAAGTGHRGMLAAPLLREGTAIGAILLRKMDTTGFTPSQMQLVEAFADQAVIAIENVRLFNETKEALERQTATSEVLKTISRAPFELQPILDTLVQNAARLTLADNAELVSFVDGTLRDVAQFGDSSAEYRRILAEAMNGRAYVAGRGTVVGRTLLEGRPVHVVDVLKDADYKWHEAQAAGGFRTILGVPLVRQDRPIGVIVVWRHEVAPFTDKQIELLTTFADQAVIAMENVRLFNETKEALEQQTAVAEVLKTISRSAFDLQPVLDVVLDNAVRLAGADIGWLSRVENEQFTTVAYSSEFPQSVRDELVRQRAQGHIAGPWIPLGTGGGLMGFTLAEGRTVHLPDVKEDPELKGSVVARLTDTRTVVGVPMLRDGRSIGGMVLARYEVRPFGQREIELVQTFADQAAIAIENVRLFSETNEALDQQTAIADMLSVIGRSAFELGPVLQAVVERAMSLSRADGGYLYRYVDADHGYNAVQIGLGGPTTPSPSPIESIHDGINSGSIVERVRKTGSVVQVEDVQTDPAFPEALLRPGVRTVLGVPLTRDGRLLGVLGLRRMEVQAFTPEEVRLVQTFADQAVIAIENVRLLNETKEALDQQTAVSEVLKAISRSAFELQPVLDAVIASAVRLCSADNGFLFRRERGGYSTAAHFGVPAELVEFQLGRGLMQPGEKSLRRVGHYGTSQIVDVLADADVPPGLLEDQRHGGFRTVLSVPLRREGDVLGVISLRRNTVRAFSERETGVAETFADQAVIAIENARLFNEIQEKSRELQVASRHKSEFLANMSHELRTPLNAIIGFSEVLIQGLFGEVNEKQRDYLQDVIGSGQHLLSLINDILDLSKIEAGRMELELSTFSFRSALQSGVTIVRERAARNGITLNVDVSDELDRVEADERKVKQILYNLLSNAVKFTPDGGNVNVTVRRANGDVRVDVQDTGIGIAEADQARIFEEFQQVGRERSREGTGLGLTLTKRFVELHGGRIWLESAPGRGSTFTFTLPLRQAAPVRA